MNVIKNDYPFPHYILENIFDDLQLVEIKKELSHFRLNGFLSDPEDTGTARDENGNVMKNNKGIFLEEFYNPSHIMKYSATQRHIGNVIIPQVFDNSDDTKNFYFRLPLFNPIRGSALVSYYENNSEYKSHRDLSLFTILFWVFNEPKQFEGGDISFTDYDYNIECKSNFGIVFPGQINHQVEKLNMVKSKQGKGFGRYAISTFFNIVPEQPIPPEENPEQNQ